MADSLYFPTHIGLLTEEHRENIGPALWEFLWLISKTTKEITEDNETIGIVLGGKPIKITEIIEEMGGSERNVRRNLKRLKDYGYVVTKRTPYGEIYKVKNSKKFYKNRADKNVLSKKGDRTDMPRERTKTPVRADKSVLSNKIKKDKEEIKNIYVEIINYLNQKAGKRFSPKSEANKKLINGRISEGRTLEDFKQVIDVKCEQWLGDEKMDAYLRPATLFRPTNFENYLNQVPVKAKKEVDPRDKEIALQQWIADGNEPNEFNWNN